MSKYSEKRLRATCVMPQCTETGTRLKLIDGRPDWVCDWHAEGDSRQRNAG